MTPFGVSGFLAGVTSLGFGLFVLLKGRDRRIAKIWFAFALSVAGWGFGAMWIGSTKDPHSASLAWFVGYAFGVIWIAALYYHFVCVFLGLERPRSVLLHYAIGVLFLTTYPSKFFFKRMDFLWDSMYFVRSGVLHYVFFCWWSGLVIYSNYLLLHAYSTASPIKKNQIKYFFLASLVGFTGGSLSFLSDFGIDLYPWGHFTVFLYPIIMSYAILKHQLLDINVVIRKTLIYSLVTAGLASVYAGAVTLIARLVENYPTAPISFSIGSVISPFALSGLLAGVTSLALGFFVLLKSPDEKIRKIWFLFALSVAAWGFGSMWMGSAKSAHEAILCAHTSYFLGVVWIAPLFYHFIRTFLELKHNKYILIHYLIGLAFLPTLPTPWFFQRVDWVWNSLYYPRGGILLYVFFCWWTGLVIYSHILLFRAYKTVSLVKKSQIKYFFLATAVGYSGGSLCYLPNFGIDLYPWGNFTVFLYPIIMSYAILKHQMMDINIVIRKTLIYSLVTAGLAAVYVGTITLLAQIWGGRHGPVSVFSSALAAVFITLLFNPLRVRIQRIVDRHFSREAVDQTVLREITSAFVHEIKTPLSNIALPAELTLMDIEDLQEGKASANELIPKIKKRMRYIMDQALLAGSKVEAVREATVVDDIARSTANLDEVIHNSLKQMAEHLRAAKVETRVEAPETLNPIRASAKQLEVVFGNLIKNASEAMAESTNPRCLEIAAKQMDGKVIITVTDTGPGIKPADLPLVFQSHYTTKGPKGAGIGLTLCRQIIEAHKGTIEVSSPPGHGATFTITLPINAG